MQHRFIALKVGVDISVIYFWSRRFFKKVFSPNNETSLSFSQFQDQKFLSENFLVSIFCACTLMKDEKAPSQVKVMENKFRPHIFINFSHGCSQSGCSISCQGTQTLSLCVVK